MNKVLFEIRDKAIRSYLATVHQAVLRRRVRRIGKKDKIQVVFFAMNVAMWRYQGVYEQLSREDRFACHIVLTVPLTVTKEQRTDDLKALRLFFDSKGIEYFDYDDKNDIAFDVKACIDPDILFYPQPYEGAFPEKHAYSYFLSKLLCYIPYGMTLMNVGWYSDTKFHNLAWKLYYPFQIDKDQARKYSRNRGVNMIISGYTNLDGYLCPKTNDVWKIKDKSIKRLIWAPHFSMPREGVWFTHSNFLWMSQLMIDIANRYKDQLQIAFKPHPRLKSELYLRQDWGPEKTENYYRKWSEMDNTFVETGEYIDLFKTSDAMIHDCDSFMIEYLFVNKPVAFVSKDITALKSELSDFGEDVLSQHYLLENQEDVVTYIEDVVLGGNDSLLFSRTGFFSEVLMPKATGSTSEIIVNDIKKSLKMI